MINVRNFRVSGGGVYKKLQKNPDRFIVSLYIFLFFFAFSFITSSLIIQPKASRAVTGLSLVSSSTMTLASSGNINLIITPTSTGALSSASHNLTASTNVPTGYKLTLVTATTPSLPTVAGTLASPTTLGNNTWGYALAKSGAIGTTNDFNASYVTPTPSAASKWANPTTQTTIKNTTNSTTGDTTTVYYGAKITANQKSGTYNNTVRYTATANTSTIPNPTITSITPNSGTTAGGTAVQIVGAGFTVNDESVATAVTIGGAACTGVTISSNTPTTGRDTIYCNVPAHPTTGATNVVVTTWKSTATLTNGYTYVAPTATITAPTSNQILNAGTTSTTLSVTTNYASLCYYGTASNPTTQMSTTGNRTTHSQTITGLANGSTNTRYVRCQAATGHSYGSNVSVTFYVRTATPAAPTLSPANGSTVINGATTITVISGGATCTWGTSSTTTTTASGTTRATTVGVNTLYYSCIAGSGNTQSQTRTGSWTYTGAPTPPAGSNPSNISSTNPHVLDVYPTTGWAGDVVAITSNALFTNVSTVTIGGTACANHGVITSSLITCTLPSKTAGTTNDIVVTNNGTNVTNAATYRHMKVTYFNPSSTTVNISGTNYTFYPNGFTSANCSAMSASNAGILATPAASMVYVRDARNNQTYKVKKMVDNKCWMVDNLKYLTANMTFNNGDHRNNGDTTALNTVDETNTASTANLDKRFYNNPMSNGYCYGTTNMPANSLTRCGYQYNWYAATNGTGTYAQSTAGTNVTGNICPANFRLPSAMSNGSTATSNGTSDVAADLPVLNASMSKGWLAPPPPATNYGAGWQPAGAWGGVYSEIWTGSPAHQGFYGYFLSSTVQSDATVRVVVFGSNGSNDVGPGNGVTRKSSGQTVRCVMP